MGQLWLSLLTLTALFGLAAPQERLTAQIQAKPPAPTLYHQLQLSCEVLGDPGRQEFLWDKEGSHKPLQRGPSSVLHFHSFNKSHLGTYSCTASSLWGTAVATYNLQINDLVHKVFVFPRETKDSHVLLRAQPGQPLQTLTLCLRSYTDLARPHGLFSYATMAQANEVLLFKSKPSTYEFHIGGKFVIFTIPLGAAPSEQHVCASWESATGIVRFWLDGRAWPRKGLQKGYRVGAEAAIVLGQDQDSFGGGFDAKQSFVGEISSVYLWDVVLSTSAVKAAMEDTPYEAPIFGWRNFPYRAVGEVYLKP